MQPHRVLHPSRLLRRCAAVILIAGLAQLGSLVDATGASAASARSKATQASAAPRELAQAGGVLRDIQVEGNQRVDIETVKSYIRLQPGDAFDTERLDESLKALFATGYFADVTLHRQNDTLLVRVVENPIINRIAFEGNKRIEEKTLVQETQLKPRQVFTRTRVQNDVRRISELYRRQGRFAARVEPKIIKLDQNRVDLVFEIEEGAETKIDKIVFIGNKRYSDSALRDEISSRESRWYRFFGSDDVYDPDRVSFDRERLRKYYLKNGYADFRVLSAVAELTEDRKAFVLTFTVEEGERYKLGEIEVISQLQDQPAVRLRPMVKLTSGDWYNADQVETTIDTLTDSIGSAGYAFVDVRPRVKRNREAQTIDVAFEIGEGPRVYVDRIEIDGNVRTLDRVIRREFRLVEGDAFNTSKLRRTRQRLRNLGYFQKMDINNVASDRPDRTTVKVEVQEQSTGELSLGAGFSSSVGPLGDISIRERNFLGKGQDLRAGFQVSSKYQQVDVSFTEPYFLDRPIAAGVDVFKIRRNSLNESSYNLDAIGTSLRAGYRITEALSQRLKYTLRDDDIEPRSQAATFIQKDAGSRITSSIGQELFYDKRDSRIDPTDGYYLSVNTEFAGVGGDAQFVRVTGEAIGYYSIANQWIVSAGAKGGAIESYGDRLRLNDRFYLGGETLRGFAIRGVGPRSAVANSTTAPTNDALGGKYYYSGNVELTFPLGLPEELGIKGKFFTEAGSLWGIDDNDPSIADSPGAIRASVGVGLAWRSPLGPLRVDITQAVKKEPYDKTDRLLFSFGTRF